MPANVKQKGPYNIDLQNAVKHLYNEKVITQDKEIADNTGFSKGQVSSYVNGRSPMSESFKTMFEKTYRLNLADFTTPLTIPGSPAHNSGTKLDEAIKRERAAADRERESWERERRSLVEDKAFLQDLIRTNLTLVQATLKTTRFRQEANGEIVLAALARLVGKQENDLIEAADMRMSQIEQEHAQHDNVVAASK